MAAQAPFAYQRPMYLAVKSSDYTSLLPAHAPINNYTSLQENPYLKPLNDINNYLMDMTQKRQDSPILEELIALHTNLATYFRTIGLTLA